MGLREEIAKVRMARSRLEVTREKLQKLDEDQKRLERMRVNAKETRAERQKRTRRGLSLD